MPLRVNHSSGARSAGHPLHHRGQWVQRPPAGPSSVPMGSPAVDAVTQRQRAERMRGELAAASQGVRRAEQAADLIQGAERVLHQVNSVLVRLRELAEGASWGDLSTVDRQARGAAFDQLLDEIDRLAQDAATKRRPQLAGHGRPPGALSTAPAAGGATRVGGATAVGIEVSGQAFVAAGDDGLLTLGNRPAGQRVAPEPSLDGTVVAMGAMLVASFHRLGLRVALGGSGALGVPSGSAVDAPVGYGLEVKGRAGGGGPGGPKGSRADRLELGIGDLRAAGPLLDLRRLSIDDPVRARMALAGVDAAASRVAAERGRLGAAENRLAFAIAYSENEIASLQPAHDAIPDADAALEVAAQSRARIMLDSGHALVAQGKISAAGVQSLL